ncbi:rab3 GTPase-activating protein catalytic subunit-like isoform X2 [Xenia sp. Carnegie-2017]|uniref:rab3 GTPase-activating protein catalytic subunit-like isoform X2 n=1 Tax=Xenia sp. Carnegie-2017 TaxID=2897299 RepID=UPI001F048B1E|nr:rab3 GTPase-activating protein catalytic subunit-like isoform X2 [Xenia sp. Carnegie-2017]
MADAGSANDDENESSVFEITDFTTASDWERFVCQIEEVLHKWKLDNSKKKASFLQCKYTSWEILSETVHFSDFCFDLSYHCMKPRSQRRDENSDIEEGLPNAVLDMCDLDSDFPPRVHCLSRWFGLKEFLVLSPSVENAAITSESRCHLLLSSISMALSNSKCYVPLLVQLHEKWRRLYRGICLGSGFRTMLEMVHLRRVPKQFNHLKGLLDVFKDKFALRGTNPPAIVISIRFTYFLNEWSDSCWPQAPPDFDSYLGDEVGLCDLETLPFGTSQDAVSELHLSASWPCLSEDVILDNAIYSDLDPMQAPQWHVRVRMTEDAGCLLGEYLSQYLELCRRKDTTSALLKQNNFLEDCDDTSKDFSRAFQRLTKPVLSPNIQLAVHKATSKITGSTSDESPIPTKLLDALVKHLFSENQTDCHGNQSNRLDLRSFTSPEKDLSTDKYRGLKGSPKDSLTYSLAVCFCLLNHSYGGLRAVAYLWQVFVLEMRYRWEKGVLLPRLDLQTPNHDCCLIHQKLQMLNCCIARKCLSKKNTQEALKHQQHIPLQHPWSRSSHDNVNDSSDEEFFEALEDQDGSDEESEAWTATTEIAIKREER